MLSPAFYTSSFFVLFSIIFAKLNASQDSFKPAEPHRIKRLVKLNKKNI